ncbi:phage holin family protein [Gracilibacillus saliphilus]|uniref:phage holin family protein n=1 Tax=Gracilibacillus saliphilus TaxID=543890 RepID=UPI0013CFF899|nr:phage holin family protein [Gracilibacillus saliphilus]
MENILEFVIDDALIIIPALLVMGWIFKNTPDFKDWLIPYALLVLGVICSMLLLGFSVESFIQGILVTGAAVLGNQLVKQYRKEVE